MPALKAQTLQNTVNQFIKINNSSNLHCSEVSKEELAQECFHKVCSDQLKKQPIEIGIITAMSHLSPERYQEFKQLDKNLTQFFTNRIQVIDQLIPLIKNLKDPASVDKISQWSNEELVQFTNVFLSDPEFKFDPTLLPQHRKLKYEGPYTDPAFVLKRDLAKDFSVSAAPLQSLQLKIINFDEFLTLISAQAAELENKLKSNNKNSAFSSNKFNAKVKNYSKDENSIIKEYQEMINLAEKEGIKLIPQLCKQECIDTISKVISDINLSNLAKRTDLLSIADRVAICKSEFVATYQENMFKNNFKTIWPEVKNSYQKNILSKLSKHSSTMINKYLTEKLKFDFENQDLKVTYKVPKRLEPIKLDSKKMSEATLLAHAYNVESGGKIDEMCPIVEDSKHLIWDYLESDVIGVSPFSCEHQEQGKSIVAHEVGHAIDTLFDLQKEMSGESVKKYQDFRQCVTNNSPKKIGYDKKDEYYTDEDIADVMSHLAMKDFSADGVNCSPVRSINGNYSFEFSGDYDDNSDNHSPGIIRLLRDLHYRSPAKMPQACAELIKQLPDQFANKCRL